MFDPVDVFRELYRDTLYRACGVRVMAFERSSDVILRSGLIDMVENHLRECFDRSIDPVARAVGAGDTQRPP